MGMLICKQGLDTDTLRRIDGLYVGQLNEYELSVFHAAREAGLACRASSYSPAGFLLGVQKVKVLC